MKKKYLSFFNQVYNKIQIETFLAFISLLILFTYLYCSLIFKKVFLADDILSSFTLQSWEYSSKRDFLMYVFNFLNSAEMSSRPVSCFFFSSICYFVPADISIYYLNYLFFLIALPVIYITIKRFLPIQLAILTVLFYALVPIGSSTVFSPIMMNSSLATIFFCLSIYFLKNESYKNYAISVLFMLLSALSYEIFLPALIINIFLIRGNIFKISYLLIFIIMILIYRRVLEPYFFSNFYHRDNTLQVFNFSRNYLVIKELLKSFFYYLPVAVFKGIRAMKYYTFFDFLIFFISCFLSILCILRLNFKIESDFIRKVSYVSLCGLIFSTGIFFLSDYHPNIFGFGNRNLGAIRLFFSLLIVITVFFLFRRRTWLIKIFMITGIIFFSITTISIKNAWIYAREFNNKLFLEIKKTLPKQAETNEILYMLNICNKDKYWGYDAYDEYSKDYYILQEPIFREPWESSPLQYQFYIPASYKIQHYFRPNYKPAKYYLFDLRTKSLILIDN